MLSSNDWFHAFKSIFESLNLHFWFRRTVLTEAAESQNQPESVSSTCLLALLDIVGFLFKTSDERIKRNQLIAPLMPEVEFNFNASASFYCNQK